MTGGKTDIWVYAHWLGMEAAQCVGVLSAHQAKGRKAFSFAYDPDWLRKKERILLDPDISWFSGPQFAGKTENFGVFLDSMPDRWGRMLMKRRAVLEASEMKQPTPNLYDIDFLLGVQDESRMGGLRFKLDPEDPFLAQNHIPIPPLSSIRELQQAAGAVEGDTNPKALRKWLAMLVAPGSSLGGARPKANVLDEAGELWIAKFPSRYDDTDKGAWEYVLYQLARNAGINMAESRIMKVGNQYHTFLTKRFDRQQQHRIHFASAMTMTGNNEETIKEKAVSYLDLAEFIRFSGANAKEDLPQLWRRIVFHLAVSNTDDHLRNHGFLLSPQGWRLSPAYDLNPSMDKDGFSLNIDLESNALDPELAFSVGQYFNLDLQGMRSIQEEVQRSVRQWRTVATQAGIRKAEQEFMAGAFRE